MKAIATTIVLGQGPFRQDDTTARRHWSHLERERLQNEREARQADKGSMPRRYHDSLSPSSCSSPSPAPSPSRHRARSTSYSDRRQPASRSQSLARRSLSASRSRSPSHRGSHSRSRTSRAARVKDKVKDKKEIPYGFLAGIGVSALLLHKYWPKGWVHGEDKYWDNKVGRAAEVVVERPRGVLREGRVRAGPVLEEMREGWREERAREKGLEVPEPEPERERERRRGRSVGGAMDRDRDRSRLRYGLGVDDVDHVYEDLRRPRRFAADYDDDWDRLGRYPAERYGDERRHPEDGRYPEERRPEERRYPAERRYSDHYRRYDAEYDDRAGWRR